jgi:hypothetical protein
MPQNDLDYELSDPYLWWQRNVPLRIVVRPRGPRTLSSDDRVVSDASDDQSVPGQGPGASYLDQGPIGSSSSGQGLLDFLDTPATPFANSFAIPHPALSMIPPPQTEAEKMGRMAWAPPIFPHDWPALPSPSLPATAWTSGMPPIPRLPLTPMPFATGVPSSGISPFAAAQRPPAMVAPSRSEFGITSDNPNSAMLLALQSWLGGARDQAARFKPLPTSSWDSVPNRPALPPTLSVPPNGSWNERNPPSWQMPASPNVEFPAPPAAPELDPASAQYLRALRSNLARHDYGRQLSDAMIASPQPDGAATAASPEQHLGHSQLWPVGAAGRPDGGPWTRGRVGGNDPRIISDATPYNDWKPGAQYANSRRSGPIQFRIGGQWVEVEQGQAARLDVAQTRALDAAARVRELDPNWRPRPSAYESVEGLIRAYEAEAQEAQARARQLARLGFSPKTPNERPRPMWEGSGDYDLVEAYRDEPKTLEELQRAVSIPKSGYDLHHIVEQTSAEQDGFPRSIIDAPDNIVRIPRLKHWEINGWYGRRNDEFGRASPREYLRGRDWAERVRVGRVALIRHGVLKP